MQIVREARARTGMSQEAFARALDVSRLSVQNWESGRNRPTPAMLRKIRDRVPGLSKEIGAAISQFKWHPGPRFRREEASPSGMISFRVGNRRYSEDTIVSAHEALDLVIDNAPSEVVKKVQRLLEKHAAQWKKE